MTKYHRYGDKWKRCIFNILFIFTCVVIYLASTILSGDRFSVVFSKYQKMESEETITDGKDTYSVTGQIFPPIVSSERARRIIFCRVPKCGSTTTWMLFKALSQKNNWKYPKDLNAGEHKSTNLLAKCVECKPNQTHLNWLRAVVQYTFSKEPPLMISGHLAYIDFRRFVADDWPVYISIVRDPLERLVSEYYYHQDIYTSRGDNSSHLFSYDECVEKNLSVCTAANQNGFFKMVPYFCGHDPICSYPNKIALHQAKTNIIQDYAVVGLLEAYKPFLVVLEEILPVFFSGASERYHNSTESHRLKNINKPPVQECTASRMRQLLDLEYELYDWIKHRFSHQYDKLFQHQQ